MNTLFLLQFACCIIVSMLGLILVLSRFQIRWCNRRYEASRWFLAFSMFVLAGHYVLQMLYGFRAKSDEIGAVVNVLFYCPLTFIVSYAAYNVISSRGGRRNFAIVGVVSYALILLCFFVDTMRFPRECTWGVALCDARIICIFDFVLRLYYSRRDAVSSKNHRG